MAFPAAFTAMLQAIGALLVFVAGYLGLVICTIVCLVIAELISDRSRDVRLPAGNDSRAQTRILRARFGGHLNPTAPFD